MPFSSGTYTVAVDFGTEAASPPIEIALLDQQMQDLATALSNCMLRDGTGNPTAAISFDSQDVTAMNTLTIANALADTNTLILSKGGSKIVLGRSSDDSLTFIIGSESVGGTALSIKNTGGVSAEMQLTGGTILLKTNTVTRLTISSTGQWTVPGQTTADTPTMVVGSSIAIVSGGEKRAGIAFTTTANFGVFVGQDAPTITAAKGSLYLCSNGSSSSTRLYIASNSSGAWVAVTTAS